MTDEADLLKMVTSMASAALEHVRSCITWSVVVNSFNLITLATVTATKAHSFPNTLKQSMET